MQRTILAAAAALLLGFALAQDGPLPEGPGVDLVYAKCQQCHGLNAVVDSSGLPDFLWADTLDLMTELGLQITEEEYDTLYTYFTTYMGTEPPPEPAEDTAAQAEEEVDGAQVYSMFCQGCHQPEGAGLPGAFPPLAQHAADLAAADRDYLPLVLLYGVYGEISVDGTTYNGAMPAWPQLSGAQVAAVINYVSIEWDAEGVLPADFAPYTPDEIAAARGQGLDGAGVLEARPDVD